MKDVAIAIMAAGKGTRMDRDQAKVLVEAGGRPLLDYVLEVASAVGSARTVVIVGHQAEKVKQAFADRNVEFVIQDPQLGTGHAVMQTEPLLKDFEGTVVVLSGDMILVKPETVRKLVQLHQSSGACCTVLSTVLNDPAHYGRIVRNDDGSLKEIVEYRDADQATRAGREINSGTYAFSGPELFESLHQVNNENDQDEYYLTDVIAILRRRGKLVLAMTAPDPNEAAGINSIAELKAVEALLGKGGLASPECEGNRS